jgi:DNA-binding transcriptional regulator YiaG
MKKYRDEIAMVCHEIMKDGQNAGLVSEEEMREFEENCFEEEPPAAKKRRPAKTPAEAV